MRALLLATAALTASPAAAQNHSAHAQHAQLGEPQEEARAIEHGAMEHMDHQAKEHAQAEPGAVDHAQMDHAQKDHAQMDHSQTNHGAMDHSAMDHAQMNHAASTAPPAAAGPPLRALEGPEHAADTIYGTAAMAPARQDLAREHGKFTGGTVMLDRLEARLGDGEELYLWEAQGWYGGDIDRLWVKSEGEGALGRDVEAAEVQALWSHAIDPWFDVQAGIRYDLEPDSRAHAVLGLQGLAPYMFEVDAAAFLSDRGDLTARLEAEYDQRITQRLILQPRAEVSLAAQDIAERGIGAGVSSVEAGLRLRYEIAREFAPYIGVGYEAKLGETADRARAAGEDPNRLSLLLGVRAWF